ncbi:copper-binding protein [Ancylobacter pratisalsi]|uniref:Copper-binding protein n=1 Tax=Ancylobacter pratisalsi TaxID=1745854 RepID=A0A6P1YQD5_9HYPH|nr:copper-binding protein [Ancylobacter pratisalsi]QIB35332.1 copper-binding protein [Ancylobacter pratisalsi]
MTRTLALVTATALSLTLAATAARAEGDMTLKPTELEELTVGLGDAGYGVSQKTYELETGTSYSLMIKSTGNKECAWQSPGLFQSIFLRKVEAGGMEIKAIHLTELEFEEEGEAEMFFVPIKPGTFAWYCKGMEERGMSGEFVVR